MKLLAIGDPHFKIDNSFETDILEKEVIRIIEEHKPDCVVCLGDTLDRFAKIHVLPLTRAIKFLKSIADRTSLILIIGNHDRINNKIFCTDEHPFTALKNWNNTYVADKPIRIDQFNVVAVPYVPPGRFHEALQDIDLTGIKYILAHQEFKGADMGDYLSDKGDVWDSDIKVISGHIHDYQVYNNIYYVGTPFQHAYYEREDKALMLFTDDEITRIPIRGIPIKKVVKIDFKDYESFIPEPNTKIKLYIRGTIDQLKSINKKKWENVIVCFDLLRPENGLREVRKNMCFSQFLKKSVEQLPLEREWLKKIQSEIKTTI